MLNEMNSLLEHMLAFFFITKPLHFHMLSLYIKFLEVYVENLNQLSSFTNTFIESFLNM